MVHASFEDGRGNSYPQSLNPLHDTRIDRQTAQGYRPG